MKQLLFLFDTKEKDLARDFVHLLEVLGARVAMIPRAPNAGLTLQEKESRHFDACDAAVFLLTPGCIRNGQSFPSPSVSDEMGQAKQLFRSHPEKVVYLVDSGCNVQAVDQKAYIQFSRDDIRSVLSAVTELVENLMIAGVALSSVTEPRPTPGVEISQVAGRTSETLKKICETLIDQPNASATYEAFDRLLKVTLRLTERDANFAKRDLQTKGLVTYQWHQSPVPVGVWQLTNLGYELVRYEARRAAEAQSMVLPWLSIPQGPFSTLAKARAEALSNISPSRGARLAAAAARKPEGNK